MNRERGIGRPVLLEVVRRLSQRDQLTVVIADIEDRGLDQVLPLSRILYRIFPRAFCGPGISSR